MKTSKRTRHLPWKLFGLAGIAGVAATGAIVVRKRRAQRDLQPDELRERLHKRLEAVGGTAHELRHARGDRLDAEGSAPARADRR